MSVDERVLTRLDQLIEKADHVLAAEKPNPPNVIGFPTLDSGAFSEWQTQSLAFLVNLLSIDHVYVENFREVVVRPDAHGRRCRALREVRRLRGA